MKRPTKMQKRDGEKRQRRLLENPKTRRRTEIRNPPETFRRSKITITTPREEGVRGQPNPKGTQQTRPQKATQELLYGLESEVVIRAMPNIDLENRDVPRPRMTSPSLRNNPSATTKLEGNALREEPQRSRNQSRSQSPSELASFSLLRRSAFGICPTSWFTRPGLQYRRGPAAELHRPRSWISAASRNLV
jgi:hypothetical protein